MGITSEKTSCIMCVDCYQKFAEWVINKMLIDQENFGRLITHIRRTWQHKQNQTTS
jgi:hypothetical protein